MDNNPFVRVIGENGRHESKRAHAAFLHYCEMGPARSLSKVFNLFKATPQPLTTSFPTLANWSKNFFWVERSAQFDIIQQQKALEAYEAKWREQIMSGDEVLGRLSQQARSSIAEFIEKRSYAELDKDGNPTGQMVDSFGLNWEMVNKNGHLIKSITQTANGPRIELHDGQSAIVQIGKYHKLFVERSDVSGTIEHTGTVTSDDHHRAISSLVDFLRDCLPGAGAGQPGEVAATE